MMQMLENVKNGNITLKKFCPYHLMHHRRALEHSVSRLQRPVFFSMKSSATYEDSILEVLLHCNKSLSERYLYSLHGLINILLEYWLTPIRIEYNVLLFSFSWHTYYYPLKSTIFGTLTLSSEIDRGTIGMYIVQRGKMWHVYYFVSLFRIRFNCDQICQIHLHKKRK